MTKLLYLFDIDGTLISPGPSARSTLNQSFKAVIGKSPDLQIEDVAGFTDPTIVRNTLRKLEMDGNLSPIIDQVLSRYLALLEAAYSASKEPFVYEDAMVLLDKIESSGNAFGLLSGNIREGAKIKLGRFDLFNRFPFGVFGDDGETRTDLLWIARETAWNTYRELFRFEHIVIIGDTPNDACIAVENYAKSIIVCRRPEWREKIKHAGADIIVDQLDSNEIEIPKFENYD